MTTINATNTPQLTTNGQVIIGSTGAFPVANTITAGSGITVTNGAGSISIAASGGGGGISQGTISGNYYVGGSYFNSLSQNSGSVTYATGTLYFIPFFTTASNTFKNIGVLTSATATGNTVLGIYNDSGRAAPTGSPITNSNSTSLANSTNTFINYTFSSTITLSAGIYWLAFSCSAACTYLGAIGLSLGSGKGLGLASLNATSQIAQAGWSQVFVYSATLPAVGTLTATSQFSTGDSYVWLQAN